MEILIFKTPDEWELVEFMLTISEANIRNAEMNALITGAWHDGWYGEAGYEPGSSWAANLTEAELEGPM